MGSIENQPQPVIRDCVMTKSPTTFLSLAKGGREIVSIRRHPFLVRGAYLKRIIVRPN